LTDAEQPAFGNLFGVPVYVDRCLANDEWKSCLA
jgi:hypothetical protein